ncbi:phage major capsid protein [Nocardia sp. NPDC001965]
MAYNPAVNDSKLAQTGDTMFQGYLEPEMAKDYFAEVEKVSTVQQIARKIPMGITGQHIPHWTGEVSASWLGEADEKPITKGDMTKQTIKPNKIATIFVASAEVVRANPGNYLTTMRTKVGTAIAMAFDDAVIKGLSTPFGAYVGQTNKAISLSDPLGTGGDGSNAYTALNDGLQLLLDDGKKWNGTLFDDVAEPILNGAVDASKRPLFIEATYQDINAPFRSGRVIGRPTYLSDHIVDGSTVGFMGDFSQIVWGQIGGLSYDVTDTATLNMGTAESPNLVSLWQHNLVAVRVEAEYAVLVNDPQAFVRLVRGPLELTYTLNFGGATGGTATVSVAGRGPSATIAYNAAASAVKTAIVGIDDGITADDVTVTGSAGVYTVTVPGTLSVNGASLTGGSGATAVLV